jgi:hypothetical protein
MSSIILLLISHSFSDKLTFVTFTSVIVSQTFSNQIFAVLIFNINFLSSLVIVKLFKFSKVIVEFVMSGLLFVAIKVFHKYNSAFVTALVKSLSTVKVTFHTFTFSFSDLISTENTSSDSQAKIFFSF